MNTNQVLEQLHTIYTLLTDNKIKEAEEVLIAMQIVDTKDHLILPVRVRHLIWNLYEYLVLGDENNATDRNQLMTELKELFPKGRNI